MIALRLTVGLNRNTLTITTKTRLAGWVTTSIFHSEDQRAQMLDNRVGAEFQLGEEHRLVLANVHRTKLIRRPAEVPAEVYDSVDVRADRGLDNVAVPQLLDHELK